MSKLFLHRFEPVSVMCIASCFYFFHGLFHLWDHSHHFPLQNLLKGIFFLSFSLTNSCTTLTY